MEQSVQTSSSAIIAIADDVRDLIGVGPMIDQSIIAAAVRGWSVNTQRAFRSDLALWGEWCKMQRIQPSVADGACVAAWVRALAGIDASSLEPRKIATIERYLVHVGWAYRMAGLDNPASATLVKLEVKAARRVLGVRQRQARGIRFKGDISDFDSPAAGLCLVHLLKACGRGALGLRDSALLRVAYDTGARRSELVKIDCSHIERGEGGAGALFIPSSKTDREGEGAWAYLSPASMMAIRKWRDAAAIASGMLFRRVETDFEGQIIGYGRRALHPNSITLIYRRLVRQAFEKRLLGEMTELELERVIKSISSHSIRVGVAQDNFAAGESLPAIMQAYRWKDSKTVLRYGAKLAVGSGASARMAGRFSDRS